MADIKYKKGRLLFEGNITTTDDNGFIMGTSSIDISLNQEVLLTEFNNIEYICETNRGEWGNMYGGFTPTGPDFTKYPFVFSENYNSLYLYTEFPGIYSLKIYIAIPDSNSSSEPIIIRNYINKNLTNLNWNILPQIFEENNVELTEEIEAYLRNTPENTNWNVFDGMSESSSDDGDTTEIPEVYVTYQGINSENSDIKNEDDVITFISNNYELSLQESSSTDYEATVKEGGTPIQFYVDSTPCIIDHIMVDQSPSTESINNVQLRFYSETDSDYGVRVYMWKPEDFIGYITTYDDRE